MSADVPPSTTIVASEDGATTTTGAGLAPMPKRTGPENVVSNLKLTEGVYSGTVKTILHDDLHPEIVPHKAGTMWRNDGSVVVGRWEEGTLKCGKATTYTKTSISVGGYDQNLMQGKYHVYNATDGVLIFRGWYKQGMRHGRALEHFPSAEEAVTMRGSYSGDKRTNKWKVSWGSSKYTTVYDQGLESLSKRTKVVHSNDAADEEDEAEEEQVEAAVTTEVSTEAEA